MALRNDGSRWRSEQTDDELMIGLRAELEGMSPDERAAVESLLREAEGGDRKLLDMAVQAEYITPPVDIRTFCTDDEFLGKAGGRQLWPQLLDDLEELFNGSYHECIWTGAIGYGKCCAYDTLIWTDQGLLTVEEIYADQFAGQVQAESGMRTVTARHSEGMTNTVRMRTKHGHVFEGRPNHRIRVLVDGKLLWRRLDALRPGDCAIQLPAKTFGTINVPLEVAELAGWYTAEGSVDGDDRIRFSLAEGEIEYVARLAEKCGIGRSVYCCKAARYVQVRGVLPEWRDLFPAADSHTKTIPKRIRGATRAALCAYLRGYFSGDGSVTNQIEVTTVSATLARQTQVVLTALGIQSAQLTRDAVLSLAGVRRKTGLRFTTYLCGVSAWRQFTAEIGFAQTAKQRRCRVGCNRKLTGNADHFFSFRMTPKYVRELRQAQPAWRKETIPAGLDKTMTPRRKLSRLLTQGCTRTLLAEILAVGGNLPPALLDIADGRMLFDTVEAVERTKTVCYDLTVENDPSYVSGGFVSHNTTSAVFAMLYVIYQAACLKEPQLAYGLAAGTDIYFVSVSVRKDLAQKVLFEQLGTKMAISPAFRRLKYREWSGQIRFPQGIVIGGGESTDISMLGLNVFGALMDEGNFMGTRRQRDGNRVTVQSKASVIYSGILRRMKSRYMRSGKLPGLLCLVSSKRTPNDFIEGRLRESKDDPTIFVRDYALWDVKPGHYSDRKFRVLIGDTAVRSKLLQPGEDPGTEHKIIDVPEDFRTDFERDIDGSIRDIAGIATVAIVPFISKRESIVQATLNDPERQHPFSVLEWDPAFRANFRWDMMVRPTADGWQPIINPNAPRHVHIDFAVTADSVGFVVAHVAQSREVTRGIVGEEHVEILPEIYVDFILRIIPPTGEQIELAVARSLIYELIEHGYHITFVHADSWQSTDTLQQLRKRGLRADVISVDKTPVPYEFLRDALYERRVRMYPYPTLERELRCLEFDREHNKVDHPEVGEDGKPGSKDVADALAAVVYTLTEGGVHQLPPPMMGERVRPKGEVVQATDFYFKDEQGETSLLADVAFESATERPTKANEVWVNTVAKFMIVGGGTLSRNQRVQKVAVENVPGGVRVTVRTADGVQALAQGPNEAALIFDPRPQYIRPDEQEE